MKHNRRTVILPQSKCLRADWTKSALFLKSLQAEELNRQKLWRNSPLALSLSVSSDLSNRESLQPGILRGKGYGQVTLLCSQSTDVFQSDTMQHSQSLNPHKLQAQPHNRFLRNGTHCQSDILTSLCQVLRDLAACSLHLFVRQQDFFWKNTFQAITFSCKTVTSFFFLFFWFQHTYIQILLTLFKVSNSNDCQNHGLNQTKIQCSLSAWENIPVFEIWYITIWFFLRLKHLMYDKLNTPQRSFIHYF